MWSSLKYEGASVVSVVPYRVSGQRQAIEAIETVDAIDTGWAPAGLNILWLFALIYVRMFQAMNQYELLFILKPNFSESGGGVMAEEVKKLVGGAGGRVLVGDDWGKRPLAYEIGGFNEGFYFVWGLELPEESVSLLREKLELDENVLRFLLISC